MKVLPAAEANIKEAQTAYVNGKVPFLNLVEAQRNRVGLKDRYFEMVAEVVRRPCRRGVADRPTRDAGACASVCCEKQLY